MSVRDGRLGSLADVVPGLEEGSGSAGAVLGIQRMVGGPVGAPLLVDGATYKHALFVAPCDGCYIKELWVSAAVAIAGGTNTLAFDNYDASGDVARNVLSAETWDPTGVTTLEGSKMALSATASNLYMDEGDVLNCTLVCGTMSTDGQGHLVTAIIVVPEIA